MSIKESMMGHIKAQNTSRVSEVHIRYYEPLLTFIDKVSDGLNSGSFLKASKAYDLRTTFYQALVSTYGTSTEVKEIKIGSKIVEAYGFEKLQRLQSDFGYLKNISLSRKGIVDITPEEETLTREHLVNLRELDLSFNIISSLDTIIKIVRNLNLSKLKLVGNRLEPPSNLYEQISLRTLDLSFTRTSTEILASIPKLFPDLRELHLSDNQLTRLDDRLEDLLTLDKLDISLNAFVQIPSVIQKLNIKTLNISDNQLSEIDNKTIFTHIENLDIRRNLINDFETIDILAQTFPNLLELRINGNPLLESMTVEEMEMNIIARFPNIKAVNGTPISEKERTNAELYFISKSNSGSSSYRSPCLEYLAAKHDIQLQKRVVRHTDNISSKIVRLILQEGEISFEIEVLETIEVLKLKGQISRYFKVPYTQIQLTYEISDITETIKNDLSLISSYEFIQGQIIYITRGQ